MATKTKTISFTDDYMYIKDYLDSLDNASRYICRLVQKDLEDTSLPLSDRIREIVCQELSSYSISPTVGIPDNNNNNYLKECVMELF